MSNAGAFGVRPATEDDLGAVCAIINHFIKGTVSNFRTEPQSVDDWRQSWARLHERFPWLVATDVDRVAGIAYAAPWNERAAYQWTVETTVYVDAGTHRRGVGHALYTDMLSRLRTQGFRSALAVIGLPNSPSVRLHERHGFSQVGQLVDAGFKFGAWRDVGLWQRQLQDGGQPPQAPLTVQASGSELRTCVPAGFRRSGRRGSNSRPSAWET